MNVVADYNIKWRNTVVNVDFVTCSYSTSYVIKPDYFQSRLVSFKLSMVHSKLQLEVLKLYKELLRAASNKPGFQNSIRQEFRQGKTFLYFLKRK